jgi:UDP-glucose-4-epimerase GalE
MKVLVTGGAGYIGGHVARELVRAGYVVRVYDNLSTGHRRLADGFELVVGDICDRETVAPALAGCDAVMHFAAHTLVGESVENPRKYFHNNSFGSLTLLDAVLDAGIRHFVFSSTAAIYGIPTTVPIPEDAPRRPVNPYGTSKLFFEHALEAYSRAYGLRFASLRYFNAAGADPSGEIGELHDPETHLIPSILLVAAGVRPVLQIFGNDYPTPDGTCVRDYIHVSDLAAGHVAALRYLAAGGESVALNLGSGRGHSVKEVVTSTEAIVGHVLPKEVLPRRPGDPPSLVAGVSRAQEVLKWTPRLSLDEIISSAWNWMQHTQAETPHGKSQARTI